ncbi:hypothetical protein [Deinococcus sp. SL84]|uniref:hypothetical protein n=1 Tax=Deinococcus sp. SL84 TaxID=2994663 RepID=UPI0022761DE8|nr:hypothetical protein [Deinococcus sp. SL84]MCY1703851.1 hypothetical protein [Deinococcus sp. SL84]
MSQSETKLTLKSLAAELGVTSGTVQRAAAVYERLRGEPLARQGRETVLTPQQSAHLRRAVQLAYRYEPGLERVLTEGLAKSRQAVEGQVGSTQDSGVSPDELQTFRNRLEAYREKDVLRCTIRKLVAASPAFRASALDDIVGIDVLCRVAQSLEFASGRVVTGQTDLPPPEYGLLQLLTERLNWSEVNHFNGDAALAFALKEVELLLEDLKQ